MQLTNSIQCFLAGKSDAEVVTVLNPLANQLKFFGYTRFTEEFIDKLKMELPKIVEEANKDHDLDKIVPSMQYKSRMEKRIRKKKLDKDTVLDWKFDDGEYSCRIWEWWRARIVKFPFLGLALRLVVLCQLSSCSVERVFSRLKLIQELCGGGMLEDTLDMRLFFQCNGDLHELMSDIQKYVEGQ